MPLKSNRNNPGGAKVEKTEDEKIDAAVDKLIEKGKIGADEPVEPVDKVVDDEDNSEQLSEAALHDENAIGDKPEETSDYPGYVDDVLIEPLDQSDSSEVPTSTTESYTTGQSDKHEAHNLTIDPATGQIMSRAELAAKN